MWKRGFICKVQPGVDHLYKTLLKIRQRFPWNPKEWPADELPFTLGPKDFPRLNYKDWRLDRGLVYYVPWGTMIYRHYHRKMQAMFHLRNFKESPALNEHDVQEGTKTAFELIAQNIYKNTLNNLAKRGVCSETLLERNKVISKLPKKQRNVFNLTKNDIYAVAPGVCGPFQKIWRQKIDGVPHLSYQILCCSFYKKRTLFNAVNGVYLKSQEDEKYMKKMTIPRSYGYASYRVIFGYMTFGNAIIDGNQLDSEVKLINFQFAVR